jgi:hypothetical protein
MSGLELLLKYPLSGKIVSDWVMSQMLESFKDESVPDDFKNYMLEQGVDNDKLAVMIDAQPRSLFDVFDANDIIIQILLEKDETFSYKIFSVIATNYWKTRKEAEMFAIEAAFEILENKLSLNEITE